MSVRARVERLEGDPRVPEPCWFCQLVERATRVFYDYLTARGVALPEPVCINIVCDYCGVERRTDITGLTFDDLELRERWQAALRADDPQTEELIEEYISRCDARGGVTFGEHYFGASEAADDYIKRWFDENADRLKEAA
jgi:hypothetical protein